MIQVYIIGTSHPYQIADCDFAPADVGAYRNLLQEACSRHNIRAIAEEMSREGLKGGTSLAEDLCQQLGLRYRACDPDSEEREQLGIWNEGLVRIRALQEGWDNATFNDAIRIEYRKREEYWLQQLQALDVWPVLFICGANHAASFQQLLSESNVETKVLAQDWGP